MVTAETGPRLVPALVSAFAPERITLHDIEAQAALRAFAESHNIDASTAAELLIARAFDGVATRKEREAAHQHEQRIRASRREANQESRTRSAAIGQRQQRDRRTEIRAEMLALFRRVAPTESMRWKEVIKLVSGHTTTVEEVLRDLIASGIIEGVGNRNGGHTGYRLAPQPDDEDDDEETDINVLLHRNV
jgi:hypothetical protein